MAPYQMEMLDLEVNTKPYDGFPFGSQAHRFDVSGVHPNLKMPGSYTQVAYDRKQLTLLARRLGPGRYSLDSNRSQTPGPNWERAMEVARIAKIPHLLYRETWEREKNAKLNLGPGRYNSKDFIQEMSERVHSARGLIDMYEQRFHERSKEQTPGPGSYGKGGVPHRAFEDSRDKYGGKIPSFEWGKSLNRSLPLVGSTVAPGTYEHVPELDERISKQVGSRGPYDVFTGSRSAPITSGHMAQKKPIRNRGPADYETKSFVEDLNHHSVVHHGEFKKLDQYPQTPGERIYYITPVQAPIEATRPGPGHYERNDLSKPSSEQMPPFMHGAERFNEQAKLLMIGPSLKIVGVGRYDVNKHEKYRSRNGSKSVFKSKVPILLEPTEDKIIKERLKPHVPSARKRVLKAQSKVAEDALLTKKMLNQ